MNAGHRDTLIPDFRMSLWRKRRQSISFKWSEWTKTTLQACRSKLSEWKHGGERLTDEGVKHDVSSHNLEVKDLCFEYQMKQ